MSRNLAMDERPIGLIQLAAAPRFKAAPTHSSPSGSEAWPSAFSTAPIPAGMPSPVA
ncbi:hypothetical protein D3C72_2129720 [compost metagenome]